MGRIKLIAGDITKVHVDAIVNAANERMLGGGGVDGAIHRAAGYHLLEACRRVPEVRPGVRCPTGSARITEAFDLPARYVIHTVGPVWQDGECNEDALLAGCYQAVFSLVNEHGIRSVAFPAISCGVYRFPPERAASIAIAEIRTQLVHAPQVNEVVLVAFGGAMAETYRNVLGAPQATA